MEEKSYIEKLIQKIVSDKKRMVALILSALSLICTLVYLTTTIVSGTHLVFVLAMLISASANVVYLLDVENKNKYATDIGVIGIAVIFLGLVFKVVKVGLVFSLVYFIGYLGYALTFLLLGIYCTKNTVKPKIIKLLLVLCAAWSIYEFVALHNSLLVGITWRIFRVSEMLLSVSYVFFLELIAKEETPFAEKVGAYKVQVPTCKICVCILLVIAILAGGIGFVIHMNKSSITKTVTNSESAVTEKKETAAKKSTVTSTVIPAETEPAEVEEIKIGDAVETDEFTFKLERVEISRRVQPDAPPSYYTYYQAEKDHTYIYVKASISNKSKYALECDEIYSVEADFDGGYKYTGFNIADDNDGDFTYANITSIDPLATRGVHCLVDCPQIVEEEGKTLFITITLNNGYKYKYNIK